MSKQAAWETANGMRGYVGSPMQSEDRTARSGSLDIDDNHNFVWMRAKDGEISGFVEKTTGDMIPGTSGWYRTNDVWTAAKIAASKL